MLSSPHFSEPNTQYRQAKTAEEVMRCLQGTSQDAVIFIDIDDTIITPASKTFRKPPYNELIADTKKNKHQYSNYAEIVSNWRLQRKVMLVDEHWPLFLTQLQENFAVYGLTKMDIGRFGNIASMERWRSAELRRLGITFSNRLEIPEGTLNGASFYQGLFLTGANSKGETLLHYRQYFKTNTMVLLDDRQEQLEDVRQFCETQSIQFTGILFKGLEQFCDEPDPAVALFQKEYLIKHAKWLEDAEVRLVLPGTNRGS